MLAMLTMLLLSVDPTGVTRLDTGTDLSGWSEKHDGWTVKDGAIVLDAKTAKDHLYSQVTHSKNVLLSLEFNATAGADSGVYIYGKQFQVRDYPTAGPKAYAAPAKPAGSWNLLEFDFTDGIAVVTLNGTIIEPGWAIGPDAKRGIGLQREKHDFAFRNIRLKEKK